MAISSFVCRWSRQYLAEFSIVFDCNYSTHVAISCFVCSWSRHYLAEFCIIFDCIYSTHVAISCYVCRWSRQYLAEFSIVFIQPTWQSAVLSAGGPGTYLAELMDMPITLVMPAGPMHSITGQLGNPFNPSYQPVLSSKMVDATSFSQRLGKLFFH